MAAPLLPCRLLRTAALALVLTSALPALGATTAAAPAPAASSATASRFVTAAASDDGRTLTLSDAAGRRFAAPQLPEQIGFEQPQVSPDGRFVGWLASFDNCCQSYPMPQAVVVLDGARRLHRFGAAFGAPFAWCFAPGGDRIAYMHTFTHGSNAEFFELVRIADGRRLAHYEYPDDVAAQPRARARAPAWVRCVPE